LGWSFSNPCSFRKGLLIDRFTPETQNNSAFFRRAHTPSGTGHTYRSSDDRSPFERDPEAIEPPGPKDPRNLSPIPSGASGQGGSIGIKFALNDYMKRPWEIYLDMLILAGWICSFSQKFNYDNGESLITASASKGKIHLAASGTTMREAVENLSRQLIS
jgi:hypothetical protein